MGKNTKINGGGGDVVSITWKEYDKVVDNSANPFILVFDDTEEKEIERINQKIKCTGPDTEKLCFVKVVMSQVTLRKLAKMQKDKSYVVDSENVEDSDRETELNLALKYGVKNVPFIVGCDCYGNNIRKIQSVDLTSFNNVLKIMKDLNAKQNELKTSITTNYEKVIKQFKAEQEKNSFSRQVIDKLLSITCYDGYKYTKEAKENIDVINKAASDELSLILPGIGADNKIVDKLQNFASKYKGLAVEQEANKTIQEIKAKEKAENNAKNK